MKLVSFNKGGKERLGILQGDTVVDPLLAGGDAPLFADALAFIKSGAAGLDAARKILANPPQAACAALKDVALARADPALDHPVQRQQLQGPQRREGQHADQRQGAGVLRQDRRLRGRSRRADRIRRALLQEDRLRGRTGHRDRQGRALHSGRARARSCVRLHHRQRRDRARPPGAAHAGGHDLVRTRQRQGVRFRRAARALHRHRRRNRRSAEAEAAVARQRRASPVEQHRRT